MSVGGSADPGGVRAGTLPEEQDVSGDAHRAALAHRRFVPVRFVNLDKDPEGARLQLIQVDVWTATTLACIVGMLLTFAFTGAREPTAWLWLAFVPALATAAYAMARFPQWRERITITMYLVVLMGGAWVLFTDDQPHHHGYNTLWGVLTGVTIAERPRRAVWVGALTMGVLGVSWILGYAETTVTATAFITVLALAVSAVLGGITWSTTLEELLERTRRTSGVAASLRATNAELEHRVVQRTSELQARSSQLEAETERLRASLDQRERLAGELRDLTHRDDLTGLHNRRSFMERLALGVDALLAHPPDPTRNDRGRLTLLIIDVDHFKSVNDHYGHPTGDQALIRTANTLADAVRTDDCVARIGGEEFAVLLPSTTCVTGRHVAEGLRRAVESLDCRDLGMTGPLTISVGGVTFTAADVASMDVSDARGRRHDEAISWAFSSADKALYRAKNGGRNAVEWTETAGCAVDTGCVAHARAHHAGSPG